MIFHFIWRIINAILNFFLFQTLLQRYDRDCDMWYLIVDLIVDLNKNFWTQIFFSFRQKKLYNGPKMCKNVRFGYCIMNVFILYCLIKTEYEIIGEKKTVNFFFISVHVTTAYVSVLLKHMNIRQLQPLFL